jgi:hypothetical protein
MLTSEYLSLFTNTGFKRLFSNKPALISFLNAIMTVKNIQVIDIQQIQRVTSAPSSRVTTPSTSQETQRASTPGPISDLFPLESEDTGRIFDSKLIRYDLVVVTADNTIINVEIQKARQTYFLHRLSYYSSRLIVKHRGWVGTGQPV